MYILHISSIVCLLFGFNLIDFIHHIVAVFV